MYGGVFMVSVSKIGQVLNSPVCFSANSVSQSQVQNKQTDRTKLENYANKQVSLGYGTMLLAGVAAMGAALKTHRLIRSIATLPAVMITATLGMNLISSGSALKKVANNTVNKPTEPAQQKTETVQ